MIIKEWQVFADIAGIIPNIGYFCIKWERNRKTPVNSKNNTGDFIKNWYSFSKRSCKTKFAMLWSMKQESNDFSRWSVKISSRPDCRIFVLLSYLFSENLSFLEFYRKTQHTLFLLPDLPGKRFDHQNYQI